MFQLVKYVGTTVTIEVPWSCELKKGRMHSLKATSAPDLHQLLFVEIQRSLKIQQTKVCMSTPKSGRLYLLKLGVASGCSTRTSALTAGAEPAQKLQSNHTGLTKRRTETLKRTEVNLSRSNQHLNMLYIWLEDFQSVA